ncbi:MAG: GNAT family N-acetyltransferase [Christensenellales bacterium]
MAITVKHAYDNLDSVKTLFMEYALLLKLNEEEYKLFCEETAALPGSYAPPLGGLYIAYCDGEPAGCVAFKPSDAGVCKMKRLYVRSVFRKNRIGAALVQRALDDAGALGYRTMELGTMSWFEEAVALYRRMGFAQIQPYDPPIENTLFFSYDL